MDNFVENYKRVIKEVLAPAGCQGETDADEGKPNEHVPSSDTRDWVCSLGQVENYDPKEAKEEGADHYRGEP